jgi:hypothetical protein
LALERVTNPKLTSVCENFGPLDPAITGGAENAVIAHVRDQAARVTARFDADSHTGSDAWGFRHSSVSGWKSKH